MMTFGSLFAGIGGFDLGFERAGLKCKWQVEINKYCLKVLAKHWPDVPRYKDIREIRELLYADVICGGFPCQDISNAGKRKGITGEKSSLWKEMVRIIRMVRPKYVVVENVAALLIRGMDTVLQDLAESGYDAEWQMLSAEAFGAPHLRERVFIVAYAIGTGTRMEKYRNCGQKWKLSGTSESEILRQENRENSAERINSSNKDVSNSNKFNDDSCGYDPSKISQQQEAFIFQSKINELCNPSSEGFQDWATKGMDRGKERIAFLQPKRSDWWSTEPDVGRVAHGIPQRVDRLKCLGNAVVPQIAEYIGKLIIADQEK